MAEPKLKPGIYESEGKIFAYKSNGPKIENYPYFIATQAHPELKSSLLKPAPFF